MSDKRIEIEEEIKDIIEKYNEFFHVTDIDQAAFEVTNFLCEWGRE